MRIESNIFILNHSFIGAITNIYANSVQNNLYEACVEFTNSESTCSRFKPNNVYALKEFSIGRQLLAMFLIGTLSFIITLINEVFSVLNYILLN